MLFQIIKTSEKSNTFGNVNMCNFEKQRTHGIKHRVKSQVKSKSFYTTKFTYDTDGNDFTVDTKILSTYYAVSESPQ